MVKRYNPSTRPPYVVTIAIKQLRKKVCQTTVNAVERKIKNLRLIQSKTPILIGIYHELRKRHLTDKPVAIVVKASLKYQWVQEVIKFSDYKVKAIDTPAKTKSKFDNQFEDTDVFILNYETLKNDKVVAKLKEKNIETLLCD